MRWRHCSADISIWRTHGPIAMVILPLILWAIMLWYDRWQGRRGTRPEKRLPIHKGWLLALAYIGCLSHPAMDWLNVYGIRLLEPFSSQWFYGDTLFIIDIWIWAALIVGVWLSLRRERKGRGDWQRPAWVSFTVVCAYIFANGAITRHSEALTQDTLELPEVDYAKLGQFHTNVALGVVASPVPVKFWEREILWRYGQSYGSATYVFGAGLSDIKEPRPHGVTKDFLKEPLGKDARAYLFWSRMPVVSRSSCVIKVQDQRFSDPLVGDRFTLNMLMAEGFFDGRCKAIAPDASE